MLLVVLIVAAFAHFFADFVLQAPFQKVMGQKNKKLLHLFNHCWVYTLGFGLILSLVLGWLAVPIALLNGAVHFVIDFFTSRGSHHCWHRGVRVSNTLCDNKIIYNQKWVGPFWCIIGFDQMLHAIVMFISFALFGVL